MPPVEIHLWVKTSLQTVVFKVDEIIRKFGFKENEKDNSVYAKFKNGKFDILLTSSDVNLPLEKKKFLSSRFNVNDLGEASLVLGIKIHQDRRKWGIRTIAKAYLEKILKR